MSADPGNLNSEVESLKAQVQVLHENERRLLDMVKVSAGLLLGMAAILVVFSWFASHKSYEQDKQAIQKALETANEQRYAAFNRELDGTLNARLAAREQALDRKLAELALSIRTQLASAGGVSSNTLAQQSEETNQKIRLMTELIENRNAHPFGLLYFDYAIRTINATQKNFPAATEYFLAAANAFLRARDDTNLNTSLARLMQLCFPNLKTDDFTTRPVLDEKFAALVDGLDKANVNGKHTVALLDLRREYSAAKNRKGK
ncbi:MAG: hypothetical protein ACKODH_14080 [Limisphaerales bacterium]